MQLSRQGYRARRVPLGEKGKEIVYTFSLALEWKFGKRAGLICAQGLDGAVWEERARVGKNEYSRIMHIKNKYKI